MKPFEVAHDSRIVTATTGAYRRLHSEEQPVGAIRPPCFYGTDAAHFLRLTRTPRCLLVGGSREGTPGKDSDPNKVAN